MSQGIQQYRAKVDEIFEAILTEEMEAIDRAAGILAAAIAEDRLVHVLGAGGHSAMAAMEVFYRVGGLVQVNAMFPPGMNVTDSRPTMARLPGTGPFVLNYYRVQPGDPLIVVNFYGLNAASLDAALEAKKRHVTLITVNSKAFSAQVPKEFQWRHPTRLDLHELADVAIDNHVPYLDAVVDLPGADLKITATATLATVFVMNCLMTRTAERLVEMGIQPDVWKSSNVPGGDEFNAKYIERYRDRVHHLYPTW